MAQEKEQEVGKDSGRDAEARGLFLAGSAAFQEGRYDDALRYFYRAYQYSQRPKLLYNIGMAADRLRRDDEALGAFRAYLKQVPDARNRTEVENRIRALETVMKLERERQDAEKTAAEQAAAAAKDKEKKEQEQAEQERKKAKLEPSVALKPSKASGEPQGLFEKEKGEPQDEAGGGILSQWWFWTVAGVVVTGAVVGVVVATSGGEEREEPLEVGTGVVVTTLGSR